MVPHNGVFLLCTETVYMWRASGFWQKCLCFWVGLEYLHSKQSSSCLISFGFTCPLKKILSLLGDLVLLVFGDWWFVCFLTGCVLFSLHLSTMLVEAVASCASPMPPNLTEIDVTGSKISAFLLSFLKFSTPQYCGFVHEIIEQLVSLWFRLSHS